VRVFDVTTQKPLMLTRIREAIEGKCSFSLMIV